MELLEKGKAISVYYRNNPNVDLVMIAGSVSRGWADHLSDIEIYVLWNEAPTDDDRKKPIKELQGELIEFHPFEEDEWSESYVSSHVKHEISNFLTYRVREIVHEVTKEYDTSIDKQLIVSSIKSGIPVLGNELHDELVAQVTPYPRELTIAMIHKYMKLTNRWNHREALMKRDDWFILKQVISSVQLNYNCMFYAINQEYIQHPVFKWNSQVTSQFRLKPNNLEERLERINFSPLEDSIVELELLLDELYLLVENHYPEVVLENNNSS